MLTTLCHFFMGEVLNMVCPTIFVYKKDVSRLINKAESVEFLKRNSA